MKVDNLSSHNISIHALREEGDAATLTLRAQIANFYPRPPRGGRRQGLRRGEQVRGISIHALREEGDAVRPLPRLISSLFLSTPSARRATKEAARLEHIKNISIHALREEGDACTRPQPS